MTKEKHRRKRCLISNGTALPMRKKIMIFCALLLCLQLSAQTGVSPPDKEMFDKAVACIKEFEGWHGNHLPYVGYGHKILPGERLSPAMTREQADSLLRSDLLKLYRMCSRFGKDALLVATLSYNVGYYWLVGYGKIPKSRLVQKLESGDRNIYREYISFRCYKGKAVPSIERRRKKEFELLYIP